MAYYSFHCIGCGIYHVNESRCADCRRRQEIRSKEGCIKPKSPTMYQQPVDKVPVDSYKIKDTILIGDKLRGKVYSSRAMMPKSEICDVVVINISGGDYSLKCVRKYKEFDRIYYNELSRDYHRYDKESDKRINISENKRWDEHNIKVGDLFIHDFYCSGRWVEVTDVFSSFINVIGWDSFNIDVSEDELRKTFERRK